ncbi:uncharacterized protein METZ01_LOCUS76307 [marine metagenome]|uniref:Uncharacterized protein n=1 Tax=marine metagenome TaxID=408172 RepID=A0A381UA54_9ZZZZ
MIETNENFIKGLNEKTILRYLFIQQIHAF